MPEPDETEDLDIEDYEPEFDEDEEISSADEAQTALRTKPNSNSTMSVGKL